MAAAGEVAPAAVWRERLARAVRREAGARFAAVFTCPPGNPIEAQASIAPATLSRMLDTIHSEYLPRIEHAGEGISLAAELRTRCYAPLVRMSHLPLADEMHRSVLVPERIYGLLNSFLVVDGTPAFGWICIGTEAPSDEALRLHGDALSEVARTAAQTLWYAIDLATACGARMAGCDPALEALSPRERQIASLVAVGLSDANVAARLSLSEETVGAHLRRIYKKLGVHTRVELVSRLSRFGERPFMIAD